MIWTKSDETCKVVLLILHWAVFFLRLFNFVSLVRWRMGCSIILLYSCI